MARRSDHSREEIQQMAVRAAITILTEHGKEGLSTRKVAGAIGYTAGTLYLVFRNLDELILHVNAATLDELHKEIARQLETPCDPQSMIKKMSMAYMNFARNNFARWSLLFTHRLPEELPIPEWFDAKVAELFALVEKPIKQLLPDLDKSECKRASRVLWSGVHGACELGLNDKLTIGGKVAAEELVESLVENYLNGLIHQ